MKINLPIVLKQQEVSAVLSITKGCCKIRNQLMEIESKYFRGLLDELLSSSSISLPLKLNIYFINFILLFFFILKLEILASFTYAGAPTPGQTLFNQQFLAGARTPG